MWDERKVYGAGCRAPSARMKNNQTGLTGFYRII
jgi:hypothetical protein